MGQTREASSVIAVAAKSTQRPLLEPPSSLSLALRFGFLLERCQILVSFSLPGPSSPGSVGSSSLEFCHAAAAAPASTVAAASVAATIGLAEPDRPTDPFQPQ